MTEKQVVENSTEVAAPRPSRVSMRSLDWLNFIVADVRTGVGPFIAIYLTQQHWNVAQIGIALTVAEVAGVLTQAPGGYLVDKVRAKRLVLGIAFVILALSAIAFALYPTFWVVSIAQFALGMTGSIFGPAISAITLGLVGYSCLGARTGRNAGFGSAGNVVAALSMGWIGYHYSMKGIFYFVAALSVPAIFMLMGIRAEEIDFDRARGGVDPASEDKGQIGRLLRDRRLIIFAIFTIFWHLGNGAMLASAGELISADRAQSSSLWMGALVTVPQVVMALIAPTVGKIADTKGRKPILLVSFLLLPLRALLFAFVRNPNWLLALQVLDGFAAGIFGIVGVLMIADCSEGTGHYNLALGIMGVAVGIGASISTTMAGFIIQRYGYSAGFISLAVSALIAFFILWLFMPETRPGRPLPADS